MYYDIASWIRILNAQEQHKIVAALVLGERRRFILRRVNDADQHAADSQRRTGRHQAGILSQRIAGRQLQDDRRAPAVEERWVILVAVRGKGRIELDLVELAGRLQDIRSAPAAPRERIKIGDRVVLVVRRTLLQIGQGPRQSGRVTESRSEERRVGKERRSW